MSELLKGLEEVVGEALGLERRPGRFSVWKAVTMVRLAKLHQRAVSEGNEGLARDLNGLMSKLYTARARDMASIVYQLYTLYLSHKLPELLELLPSEKDVAEMLSE